MPDLSLQFDPTSEDAANVPFELVSDATGARLVEQNYPAPVPVVTWASSADSEGERAVSYRWPNRKISLKVEIVGTEATVKTRLYDLEQKVAKIAREGGTLKHTYPDTTFVVFDLVALEGYEPALNIEYFVGNAAMVQLEFQAKPFYRQAAVTLADHTETTLPVLVFTETGVTGDAPALGRLIVDEDGAADQQWVVWGMQRDTYSSSANAALFYEAEGRTPQSAGATAVQSGASGSGSNVVEATVGTTFSSVLSTQATGAGAHLSHFGTYRVFARVLTPTANTGAVSFALEWAEGDFRRYTRNATSAFPVDLWDNTFRDVDLGVVSISEVQQGAQQWEGRILAKSTVAGDKVRVDCFWLVPTERSGEVGSLVSTAAPTVYTARDEFDQTAGNLVGKTAPIGGVWTGAGPGADFVVETTGRTAQRTSVSDADSQFAISGLAASTLQAAQIDFKTSAATGPIGSIIGRYTDVNNRFSLSLVPGAGNDIIISKTVAGVLTQFVITDVGFDSTYVANTFYTLRMLIDAGGRWYVWVVPAGGKFGAPTFSGQDADLATGGALASGKIGFRDYNGFAAAATRSYDNFVGWVPAIDAAAFASQSIEWRHDGVLREDSTGTIYQRPSQYEGDYLTIPPYAQEAKPVRFIVKGSRNIPGDGPDSAIDDISARLTLTPRGLVVPETTEPFSPADITGLQAWYDASQITGLSNGDPVTSWLDLSGNGHTLAQAGAARPIYTTAGINSLPTLDFDGSAHNLTNATLTLPQPSTTFAVFRTDTPAVQQFVIDGGAGTRQTFFLNGAAYLYFAGSVVNAAAGPTANPTVMAANYNGASSGLYENGTLIASGDPGAQSLANFKVGIESSGASGFFNGHISEVLHYNKTLDSTERGQVTSYLGTKYGITVV